jgi:hypothetical protein
MLSSREIPRPATKISFRISITSHRDAPIAILAPAGIASVEVCLMTFD